MKPSIVAAAAMLLMATIAQAGPITKLSSSSSWNTWFDGSNSSRDPMCVMAAKYDWADGISGAVYVKWTEQVGAYLHVWKSNWRMPEGLDGADVDKH
jgi:hypothetical protein